MAILALNAGSSSLKAALYDDDLGLRARLGVPRLDEPELVVTVGADEQRSAVDGEPVGAVLGAIAAHDLPSPAVVGHRFVHGGPHRAEPCLLTAEVVADLEGLVEWAPRHQPAALAGVRAVASTLPSVPQVGCFDTAFHRTLPEVAQRLPLPDHLWRAGIRRYGFHGLSYSGLVATVGGGELGRAVLAHLGGGSSLAAVEDGRSVDTTMGFTPDGGVIMGRRSGDLDPGVLLYLLDQGRSARDLRSLVQEDGGLAGLSGGTADMEALLDRSDDAAALAVDAYCRRVRMQIGAYAALLSGLDTVAFTGGIGEHAPEVRRQGCLGLGHLGVTLDPARNAASDPVISTDGAAVTVRVVPADEEAVIARSAAAFV